MAAPIAANSTLATQFFNQGSLEKQVFFLLIQAASLENAYNTANPNNLSNRATVAVNFDQRTVTGQLTCALSDGAIEGRLVDGVQSFLP